MLLCVRGAGASANVPPTTTTSRATVGAACSPISPLTRSIGRPSPTTAAALRSTSPPSPKPDTRAPVAASSATRRKPSVTYRMRASAPSVQYASPRPDSRRGARAARSPSCALCIQSSSPVAASSATTARRVPPVAYSTPPAIRGVPSSLNSGPGPRLSVLKRHAISSVLKFEASTRSSGE